MSQRIHFLQADRILQDEYKWYLDQVAKDMGRANNRNNHVDWVGVNEKMKAWWEERGYNFP